MQSIKTAFIFLVIIFLVSTVGMYFDLFHFWWFGIFLHFTGGFFMAMLMSHYLVDIKTPSKLKNYLVVVGAVVFIGVVWEFAEYIASQTLIYPIYNKFGIRTYFIGDLGDTMNDLLMDILGALSWLVVFKKDN